MSKKTNRELNVGDLTPEGLTSGDIKKARRKAYSCGRHSLGSSLKRYEDPDELESVGTAARQVVISQIATLYV